MKKRNVKKKHFSKKINNTITFRRKWKIAERLSKNLGRNTKQQQMSLKTFIKRMLIGMRSFLIRFASKPKSSISFNRFLGI